VRAPTTISKPSWYFLINSGIALTGYVKSASIATIVSLLADFIPVLSEWAYPAL